ncbi:Crp/Fnr family transcriptional regulator [Thalassotalea psychrophila]|uniref:Crp/Fnr family transcriptional regulator n=1 Tax=Thalassotalea psychrophila TaxID=3065647 RepID=A0ABY9U5J1_9GAMM|nr:Crp/Fnr family transcriptional regulator [Colwelliaceae bacterium SQ149]
MQFSHPEFATIFEVFNRQVSFTEEDWRLFEPCLKVIDVGAKHNLQAIGEPVTHHYFIISGLVRWFYITPDGKELNKGFYGENYIAGNLSAIILNEASRFAIETLEPCKLVSISTNMFKPFGQCSSWDRLFNYSCQMLLIRNERREAELLTLSAKDRYLKFIKNFPGYIDRIPQYHVAAYLGINPVSLSKFKEQWLSSSNQEN